jgi:hypothetical protein
MKKHSYCFYLLKAPFGFGSNELSMLVPTIILLIFKALGLNVTLVQIALFLVLSYIVVTLMIPRLSNNLIYVRRKKSVHMCILRFGRYHKIDYLSNPDQIKELLKKEFIEGLQRLSEKYKPEKVRVETHGWVYWNVLLSPEVKKIYNVTIVEGGHEQKPKPQKIIASTILSLMSLRYIARNFSAVKEESMKARTPYTLELTPVQ